MECATLTKKRTDAGRDREWKNLKWKHYRKYSHRHDNYWHTEPRASSAAHIVLCAVHWPGKWNAKRNYDEIRKLHDIKLNLISTWSLIDDYHFIFMCDRTFSSFVDFFLSPSSSSSLTYIKVFVHVFVVKCQWKKRKLLLSISHLHKYYKWIWPFNAIISTISAYSSNQVNTQSHTRSFVSRDFFLRKLSTFFLAKCRAIFEIWCVCVRTKGRDLNHLFITSLV